VRICFVGKYPPIQGGVSTQNYWMARGLAERGHEVCVVTNASEVEDGFRIRLDEQDAEYLAPAFPNSGGAVRVLEPERYGARMAYLPRGNPFVTKLAGLATDAIRAYDAEIVVSAYFEPYGMAAHLAAEWTGRPVLLKHAGSDLDRLMRVPELATAYREILRRATGVITRPHLVSRFLGMGLARERILMAPPSELPAEFSPQAVPMSTVDILRSAYPPPGAPSPEASFDPRLPTIGMYGKPGESKGTFDLIAAAGAVRRSGLDFNLLLMCGSALLEPVREAAREAGLAARTLLLPFVPHWRVPAFIRACTAVAFLERDFPVVIHRPAVPREVLACGTCLIVSEEIRAKQRDSSSLVDGENILLVPDPKDHAALADRLRRVVEAPAEAHAIGARGSLLALPDTGQRTFIDAWEELLRAAVGGGATVAGGASGTPTVADVVDTRLPWVRTLLGEAYEFVLADFTDAHTDAHAGAAARTDPAALTEDLSVYLCDSHDPVVHDAARYQLARCWAGREDTVRNVGGDQRRPILNGLGGLRPTPETMADRYPLRCVPLRCERFDYDVTPLFCEVGAVGPGVKRELAAGPVLMCFARLPNLSPVELRLNVATLALIEHCDGSRTAAEIVAGCTDGPAQAMRAYAMLQRLFAAGVLAFADRPAPARPLLSGGPGAPADREGR
jgi:glycosyltransferase involved in cell wall biosynthesis